MQKLRNYTSQGTILEQKTKILHKPRISATYIRAFESEKSAHRMVEEVESHPLFVRLTRLAMIEKKIFRGHIPRKNVLEFLNKRAERAYKALREYGLDHHPDIVAALYDHNKAAMKRILTYAERRGLLLTEVENALQDISKSNDANNLYLENKAIFADGELEKIANLQKNAPGVSYPLSVQEMEAVLCDELHVTEQVFHSYFYADDAQKLSAHTIAEKLNCSVDSVVKIRSYLSSAHIEEEEDVIETPELPQISGYVATIIWTPDGWDVRMPKEHKLYIVSRNATEQINKAEIADWREIESKICAINELTNRREQAIRFMCRHQSAFLTTGDLNDLAPLSQGDIARAIDCRPDRLNRLLFDDCRKDASKIHPKQSRRKKDQANYDKSNEFQYKPPAKFITTPQGRVFLRDLLCELDEVVFRLTVLYPDFSDAKISKLLWKKFGVYRTRAAVQAARKRGNALLLKQRG